MDQKETATRDPQVNTQVFNHQDHPKKRHGFKKGLLLAVVIVFLFKSVLSRWSTRSSRGQRGETREDSESGCAGKSADGDEFNWSAVSI